MKIVNDIVKTLKAFRTGVILVLLIIIISRAHGFSVYLVRRNERN